MLIRSQKKSWVRVIILSLFNHYFLFCTIVQSMCESIYSENIDRDESKIKWFIGTLASRVSQAKKQN